MSFSHKIRVGVLRGGPSPEYDVSLKTGSAILANLPEEYEPVDVFISKDGAWHIGGVEKDPHKILKMIDVAVNALHGEYGEDGTVQNILESFNLPFTGSGSLSSAFGMNKTAAKDLFKRAGIKTPHHILIQKREEETNKNVNLINESLLFPIIIKPASSGSSIGVTFAKHASEVRSALEESFRHSPKLMVEEFIEGKEATCGVIEDFRGVPYYSLLPVEVAKGENPRGLFDYHSKYLNLESRYRVPGNFHHDESGRIQEAAVLAHKALGLRHYSRSDFILHPRRGLFILEVNTLPELTHRSSFVKSLESVGSDIKEFLSHLLKKTLGKKS